MASLLELLVSRRVISSEHAREAAALAEETGAFIGRILVSQGAVEEQLLARFLAQECAEKPPQQPSEGDTQLMQLLPERLMRNYRMVPVGRTPAGVLKLAVAEPLSVGGIDQVKRRLGMPVRLILVSSETIERLLALQDASPSPHAPPAPAPASSPVISASAPAPPMAPALARTHPQGEPLATVRRREVTQRTDAPADWRPDPESGPLASALEEAFRAVSAAVEGSPHVFVVVVGPDGARDLVLRKLCTVTWRDRDVIYLDLVAHHFPDGSPRRGLPTILDGVEDAGADEDEEKRLLRTISTAYATKTPLVLGMRKSPKESKNLSGGLRLTLGLARTVTIDAQEVSPGPHPLSSDMGGLFDALAEETAEWSEAAFAGASLRPLLQAAARAFARGGQQMALAKATAAVASRVAHLTEERQG